MATVVLVSRGQSAFAFFRKINAAVAAGELTSAQGHVLLVLTIHADAEGKCFPSLPTIAARTGYCQATVCQALREIRGTWVGWTTERGRSNTYQVLWKTPDQARLPFQQMEGGVPATGGVPFQQVEPNTAGNSAAKNARPPAYAGAPAHEEQLPIPGVTLELLPDEAQQILERVRKDYEQLASRNARG